MRPASSAAIVNPGMAAATSYWMLECETCHGRRVVRDGYLEFVGTGSADAVDREGYGGRPLEYRYDCLKGCPGPIRVVGSIVKPTDSTMLQHQPRKSIQMDQRQAEEWWRLLRAAVFEVPDAPVAAPRAKAAPEAWDSSEAKRLRPQFIERLRAGRGVARRDAAAGQSHCIVCGKPCTTGVIVEVGGLRRAVCEACERKLTKRWWQFWK